MQQIAGCNVSLSLTDHPTWLLKPVEGVCIGAESKVVPLKHLCTHFDCPLHLNVLPRWSYEDTDVAKTIVEVKRSKSN